MAEMVNSNWHGHVNTNSVNCRLVVMPQCVEEHTVFLEDPTSFEFHGLSRSQSKSPLWCRMSVICHDSAPCRHVDYIWTGEFASMRGSKCPLPVAYDLREYRVFVKYIYRAMALQEHCLLPALHFDTRSRKHIDPDRPLGQIRCPLTP